MDGCPDEDELVAFGEGALWATERARIAKHLDSCAECRKLVAAVADAAPAGPRTLAEADTEPSLPHEDEWLDAGAAVGRYRVVEAIGAGGMGILYAAHDPELDRKVALKLLRPSAARAPEMRARLLREAQAMAKLSHPNVVTVYDAGTVGERVFIAMELVEGRTLAEWLRERPRSAREIRDAFASAGRGLAAAHAKGLVHRDFKPSNVLVAWSGEVRVTDFGLVRSAHDDDTRIDAPTDPTLTRSGALMGTPAYMAPEQYAGGVVDARTDQFGFCVALYEALSGARPFAGDSVEQIGANVRAGRIDANVRARRIPTWLRRPVERGLAVDPDARFASMDALLAALAADPWLRARRNGHRCTARRARRRVFAAIRART
jgi:serine/threonine protein kinase